MKTSAVVRREIEEALYGRVPGALSPPLRAERVRLRTGVEGVDAVSRGGFPVGAITEIVGPESSGRTTLTASFAARRAAEGQVFAWVDVTDALDPESMAAAGVDLERMLWVRCGERRTEDSAGQVVTRSGGAAMVDRSRSAPSLGGGCGSPHPRSEGRGLPQAIGGLMGGLAAELMLGESRGSTKSQPGGNKALLPSKRKDRWIGTPGAANRKAGAGSGRTGAASEFSWRSEDREEQVPTDRRPARRGPDYGRKTDSVRDQGGMVEERVLCLSTPASRSAGRGPRFAQDHKEEKSERHLAGAQGGNKKGVKRQQCGAGGDNRREAMGKGRPWSAIEQGLRVTDMLLQAGGFGMVVLDLGGVSAEAVWRIPMATWFRFRAAAERSQACFVLLTQHACARSSAELVLEMEPGVMRREGRVMTGVAYGARVGRQRFVSVETRKVVAIRSVEAREDVEGDLEGRRRPPQPERTGAWSGQAAWAKAVGVADVRATAAEGRVRGRAGRTG